MDHNARIELARLSLDGLSVGDAFGERFFTTPAMAVSLIESRAIPSEPWKWTDDTAMALSVLDTLARHQGIAPDPLAHLFARRYWAEPARGYGGGAHRILQSINEGVAWRDAAQSVFGGQGSYGNGGAMRATPVGAYFWDDYEVAAKHANASAMPTHAHKEGRAGAVAVAIAAATATRMARGEIDVVGSALLEAVASHCPEGATRDGILRAQAISLSTAVHIAAEQLGNGTDVSSQDTVPFCMWAAARHLEDFEEAMWNTVSALGDRDTTCAIVGGIVALVVGHDGIPPSWLAAREPLAL